MFNFTLGLICGGLFVVVMFWWAYRAMDIRDE